MPRYFTTGDVAKICKIAHRTVVNYCESGRIANEKSPITNFRRISRQSLLAFMQKHGLPESLLADYERAAENRTVLIADDDDMIRNFMSEAVSRGFPNLTVSTAKDGYEALLQAGSLKPELLILDISMPRVDGYEVCRQIKGTPEFSNTRILVVTALPRDEVHAKALEAGADSVLFKPFSVDDFLASVAKLARLHLQPASDKA